MADYDVNLNGLLDGATELRIMQNNLRSALSQLETAATNFKNGSNGAAIAGYDGAQAQWSAGMTRMENAATTAGVTLDRIHDEYRLGDMKSANQFSSLG